MNKFHTAVAHEFLHALGFYHEHTRSDRNNFVRVNRENVEPENLGNFENNWGQMDTNNLNEPYDYCSFMHYDARAGGRFRSGRQLPVIEPLQSKVDQGLPCVELDNIGRSERITNIDINKVCKLYECGTIRRVNGKSNCKGSTTTTVTTKPDPDCKDNYGGECLGWANSGFCTSNEFATFMLTECAKSCNQCDGDKVSCQIKNFLFLYFNSFNFQRMCADADSRCPGWQRFCTSTDVGSRNFMLEHCPKVWIFLIYAFS